MDQIEELPPIIKNNLPNYISNRLGDIKIINFSKIDINYLKALSHKFIGSARSYGLLRLEEISLELDLRVKDESLDAIKPLLEDMIKYLEDLKKNLQY